MIFRLMDVNTVSTIDVSSIAALPEHLTKEMRQTCSLNGLLALLWVQAPWTNICLFVF
jgi:hypothetical protein